MVKGTKLSGILVAALVSVYGGVSYAQDLLPADNGLATYHTAPRYRESEAHPLRIAAYIIHPIGWVLRETITRPLSYFASSTEVTRSVMGFREPYDYRQPDRFTTDDSTPDCRDGLAGFNNRRHEDSETGSLVEPAQQVFFPNVNFDFNKRALNDLGKGRCRQVAELLKGSGDVKIVLEGHTDYLGTHAYNQKLGMDRAEAVKSELVGMGVAADRLSTVSFAETKPLHPEKEDWARALNRRVEFKVGEAAPAQ